MRRIPRYWNKNRGSDGAVWADDRPTVVNGPGVEQKQKQNEHPKGEKVAEEKQNEPKEEEKAAAAVAEEERKKGNEPNQEPGQQQERTRIGSAGTPKGRWADDVVECFFIGGGR